MTSQPLAEPVPDRALAAEIAERAGSLSLHGLVKQYPGSTGSPAVDDLSLEIGTGEFVTLLGPSGCGKTTTLRMVAGFEEPTRGRIELDGKDITAVPPNKRPMALVFQNYALFPHLSVQQNVAYGLKTHRWKAAAIRDAVAIALASMNLTGLEDRFPHQLSGGQQQRVALARAMVLRPAVMLFDEPLSNLDAKLRDQMRTEIRHLQQRLGITSIYVTHDQSEAMSLSDRIVVMSQGRIEQSGTPAEVYASPASQFVADFIGRASFVPTEAAPAGDGQRRVLVFGRQETIRSHPEVTDRGLVVIRPEGVRIQAATGDGNGSVISAMYYGPSVEYEVDTADGTILVSVANPDADQLLSEGTPVTLTLAAARAYLLPDLGNGLTAR